MFRSARLIGYLALLAAAVAVSGCNKTLDSANRLGSGTTLDSQPPNTTANDVVQPPTGDTVQTPPAAGDEAPAPTAELTIGDPAPKLEIAQWVKGDPVGGFRDGHVYVVEFWATWCGPCRRGMPHISQLQEKFADQATIIGVSDEDEGTVSSFMEQVQNPETGATWDEVLKYTIALDADEATNAAYMRAAGQGGIPTAFLVGQDGHVEWIGHPMTIDEPLASVIDGTWDREAFRAKFIAEQAAEKAYAEVAGAMRAAQRDGDWESALNVVDGLIAKFPDQNMFQMAKFQALLQAERFEDAISHADAVAQKNWDEAGQLNQIAWALATAVPKPQQDLEMALRVAQRASSLKGNTDPSALDTVARVFYEQGNLEQAIAWQTKAVEHAPDGDKSLRKTLEQYQVEQSGGNNEDQAPEAP